MKTRKLKNGEVVFGRGRDSLHVNTPDGVAQNVMTRLSLWRGSWFFDEDAGTPWMTQALGHNPLLEVTLRDAVLETPHVKSIEKMDILEDPETRRAVVTIALDTDFGDAFIEKLEV